MPSDVRYHAHNHKNVSYRFNRCSFASTDWALLLSGCGLLGVEVCVRSIVAWSARSAACGLLGGLLGVDLAWRGGLFGRSLQ